MRKKETDVMRVGRRANLRDKYNERYRRFMEVMEGIYGPEAGEMPMAQLLARHRDLAQKLLGSKSPKADPFLDASKVSVEN